MKVFEIIVIVITCCIGAYILARIITRAGLDEVNKFLNRKSSSIKKQEDGTKEKEE